MDFIWVLETKFLVFSLSHVIVFYHIFPEEISDLVVHPETIAPHPQSPLIEVITEYVPGDIPERGEGILIQFVFLSVCVYFNSFQIIGGIITILSVID